MVLTCVDYKKCPYCGGDIEIQTTTLSKIKIKLVKEKDSICGEDFVLLRQLRKELVKRGLIYKFKAIKENIIKSARDNGSISLSKINWIIQKHGIKNKKDLELVIKFLKQGGGLYIAGKNSYNVI